MTESPLQKQAGEGVEIGLRLREVPSALELLVTAIWVAAPKSNTTSIAGLLALNGKP